jgi:hypothetical protein
MAIKLVLGALVLVVVGFGLLQLRSNYQDKQRMARGRVSLAVEHAKANNKDEIMLPAPKPYYAGVSNLDDALSHYSTVVAKPIREQSQINPDTKEIETWYKLEVTDFLSTPQNAECANCSSFVKQVPADLHPLQENEILVVRYTGTVLSDGVKVKSSDLTFPDFKLNQEYLLFLALDLRTRVGLIELGPGGVSTIDANGELSPVYAQNAKLTQDLKVRYGNIGNIKQSLKFRRFSR